MYDFSCLFTTVRTSSLFSRFVFFSPLDNYWRLLSDHGLDEGKVVAMNQGDNINSSSNSMQAGSSLPPKIYQVSHAHAVFSRPWRLAHVFCEPLPTRCRIMFCFVFCSPDFFCFVFFGILDLGLKTDVSRNNILFFWNVVFYTILAAFSRGQLKMILFLLSGLFIVFARAFEGTW